MLRLRSLRTFCVCVAIGAWTYDAFSQVQAPAPVNSELPLFVVEIKVGAKWDQSKQPQEQAYFKEHSANLKRLRDAGSLIVGARYSDKGLVVLAAQTEAQARAMMDEDLSIKAEVFKYELHPFKRVLRRYGQCKATSGGSAVTPNQEQTGGGRVMRARIAIGATAAAALFGVVVARSALQTPAARSVDEKVLREYAGVYQWGPNAFVYLQMWNEFSGFTEPSQLVAFDESGDIRTLYPTDRDRFFAGPGAAVPSSIESQVVFQRDATGKITSLTWQREGAPRRTARPVEIERHENVRFSNGDIRLAGRLISPIIGAKHPAIILVHGSGAENREFILPFARFLIRRGMAVLGYDKRGVGGSTGDWYTASFDDLASDVVAAFEYLKTRSDIDSGQIGLLGVSQAGWIMPLAAVRAKDLAFLISVSGAGIPVAETTIDQARNEMTARGMRPPVVEQIVGLMKLQYQFARTGEGWDQYLATREKIAARIGGPPPDTFPGTPDHPSWQFIRQLYFYDPAPTLRQLKVPTLALFGELDNNILAEKNNAAWEAALKAGGHRDYTLLVLPKANHYQWEAKVGSNAEMASLQRFVPVYFSTIQDWLARRIGGFGPPR